MKQLRSLFFVACCSLLVIGCNSDNNSTNGETESNTNANRLVGVSTIGNPTMPPEICRLEFPKIKGGNSMIIVQKAELNARTHEYGVNYSVEWDTQKKSQRWSCYQMYRSIAEAHTKRYRSKKNQYPQDSKLPAAFQFASDPYWRTGYDHGHICPSADRLGSADANYQTFFLTNMQPQVNGFNAQVWANMEKQLRIWDRDDFRDTLYVCKGGTIDKQNQILTITSKGLIVPKYFYMAILCKNKSGYKALGFWIEHEANDDTDLGKYVVSIQELERKTGIDFFCNLPDNIERRVESLPTDKVRLAWGLR